MHSRIRYSMCTKKCRILLMIYIIGFSVGVCTHTLDLIEGGWLPYTHVPDWKNIFWTSLTVLDFLTIILIVRYVFSGVLFSNLIIISDVIINTQIFTVFNDYKILMQLTFGLYILITTPIILDEIKRIKKVRT